MKSAATVVFVRKVSQFSDFKKFNSARTFLLACDVADVPLHKLFSLFSIILNDKTQFLLFHTKKKKNFNFSFCEEYVNLDYIH